MTPQSYELMWGNIEYDKLYHKYQQRFYLRLDKPRNLSQLIKVWIIKPIKTVVLQYGLQLI